MAFDRTCRNCGNLGVRKLPDLDFVSPDGAYREDGRILEFDGKPLYTPYPECYAGVDLFRSDKINGESDQEKRRLFLWADRGGCQSWLKHKAGRSPMEIEEMNQQSQLMEWQTQREEADRRWREEESRRNNRQQTWTIAAGLLASVIAAASALLGVWMSK